MVPVPEADSDIVGSVAARVLECFECPVAHSSLRQIPNYGWDEDTNNEDTKCEQTEAK
jgi:hypothetical protein